MQVVDSRNVINTTTSKTNTNFTASARACADTGSTHTILRQSDSGMVTNIRSDTLSVQLPNGACIHAHSVGSLLLPNLPTPLTAYIFHDEDLSLSLLSISDLCKAGCLVKFTDGKFTVTHNGCIVADESKSESDTLWHLTLPPELPYASASAAQYHAIPTNSSTDNSFVRLMHAAFGSPAISSFAHAIRHKYLPSLPRLTGDLLAANLPHTTPTALGHLDQVRQGQHSTKRFVPVFPDTADTILETVPSIPDTSINNHAYMHVFVLTETMHSDLTGKFSVTAFSGMQYWKH